MRLTVNQQIRFDALTPTNNSNVEYFFHEIKPNITSINIGFKFYLKMGYTKRREKVAYAIRDNQGVIYLKTIRNKKTDCKKDFCQYLKDIQSKYSVDFLLRNDWKIVKIKIEVIDD